MAEQINELKRRLQLFMLLDTLAIVVAMAGVIGDFVYGNAAFRPVWIVGVFGVLAVMTWFVLKMRAGKES